MSKTRNTVVVLDFNVLPTRPKPLDVERFISRELKVQCKHELKCVQLLQSGVALIEFNDPALAERAISKNLRHSMQCGNQMFLIPVYFKDHTVEVRIHDLPPELPAEKITNTMSQYGKVLTIKSDTWKKFFVGISNGVRVLRMNLDRPIPRRLKIDGCDSNVFYKGQPNARLTKKKRATKNNTEKDVSAEPNKAGESSSSSTTAKTDDDSNNKKCIKTKRPAEEGENSSSNNNNDQPQMELENDDDFEVVRSKHERKKMKLTDDQRTNFFYKKWKEAGRKYQEAVDDATKHQALRLQTMYKEKWWQCYQKLGKDGFAKWIELLEEEDFNELVLENMK